LSPGGIANVGKKTWIIASDDDEFSTFEEAEQYASGLDVPIFKLASSGHISPAYGYGDWPWVLEWSLGMADFPPKPR
jgi:predicted alpha/beta hydrolase family esterase